MTGRYQQRCAWVDDEELSPVFREQRAANIKQRWAWGISLDEPTIADLLKGENGDPQRVLHWRFGSQWAVRKGDWKLVDGKTLYFLGNDPGESKDLAAGRPEIVRELRILNREWTRGAGNRSRGFASDPRQQDPRRKTKNLT